MKTGETIRIGTRISEIIGVLAAAILFGVPFFFVIINSFKSQQEAAMMNIYLPVETIGLRNYIEVVSSDGGVVLTAFKNSILITFFSIIMLTIVCAMAGFVAQRRNDKATPVINFLILTGLIIPPAIVPTIWLMQGLHIFKTMFSMVMIETAITLSFSTLLYKGFMASIPREIDEAAYVDGCGSLRLFFQIIFPLLKPVTSTVIVLSAVNIFNDFVNPLYFFPGKDNVTVQVTLNTFMSKYFTTWNLLFADVILISLPPLILFIFFNKKIVAGMTAGAVKG